MCAIVAPFAARLDELAGRNRCRMTDDGDEIALAARLYAQNAEAVLVIMECYPFDESGENFVSDYCLRLSIVCRAPILSTSS